MAATTGKMAMAATTAGDAEEDAASMDRDDAEEAEDAAVSIWLKRRRRRGRPLDKNL